MTTGTSGRDPSQVSHAHVNQMQATQVRQGRRRWWIRLASAGAAVAVIAVVAAMMLTSRQVSSATTRVAPDFTLTNTSGGRVSLAAYRGKNVLLYFSEGAGCQACLVQMAQIEQDPNVAASGLVVLPIVMNTQAQISADMVTNGVHTPFLLDDGTVSKAYGVLGKGMMSGLPGHGFVLIDKTGHQRWYGEYPSMWVSPADLLKQVKAHLAS